MRFLWKKKRVISRLGNDDCEITAQPTEKMCVCPSQPHFHSAPTLKMEDGAAVIVIKVNCSGSVVSPRDV